MSRQQDFLVNRVNSKIPLSKIDSDLHLMTIDEIRSGGLDKKVETSGRLISKRDLGKIAFGIVQKEDKKIQVVIRTTCKDFTLWRQHLQLGDIVKVKGATFTTKTGEFSIAIEELKILSICLYPFPSKAGGISNTELLLRKPFISGIGKNEYVRRAQIRSNIMQLIRGFFIKRNFIEVETPILNPTYGGGYARPFVTKSHVYSSELIMRISTEIHLKKSMVGGMERVFEIGKVFRNEGLDRKHSFEFTTLEAYQAYSNYLDNSHLVENLIKEIMREIINFDSKYSDKLLKLIENNWKRIDLYGKLTDILNIEINEKISIDKLIELCKLHNIQVDREYDNRGKLVEKLYGSLVEERTVEPTFYFNFPAETTPLAERCDDRKYLAKRWDLVIDGVEIATGYTELVDAVEQQKRLKEQSEMKNRPDEAVEYDESFIDAISYGIPPMGGIGMGLDRILMILLDCSIRDVMLFPSIDQN